MLLKQLDAYFRGLMDIARLEKADASLNGIQVSRKNPEITKVAFAVDASLETFRRSVQAGAQMLFVHHGLFWGTPARIQGILYDRLQFLLENDLALYAVHLPLDVHTEFGNNYGIAFALGLVNLQPFGVYHGISVGVKGEFESPVTLAEAAALLLGTGNDRYNALPFGPETIRTVGIVSGSGNHEAEQAIEEGLDLYITGESSHLQYHPSLEAGMHIIAAGHYRTEVWGVKLLAERLSRDNDIETVFIDVPTGL